MVSVRFLRIWRLSTEAQVRLVRGFHDPCSGSRLTPVRGSSGFSLGAVR